MILQVFYIEGFWWDFRYLHFLRPTNLPRKQVLCLTCNKGLIVPFLSRFKNESRGSRKINLCLHGWIISPEDLISTLSFKENDGKKNFDGKVWKCICVMRYPIWFNGLEIQYTAGVCTNCGIFQAAKKRKKNAAIAYTRISSQSNIGPKNGGGGG